MKLNWGIVLVGAVIVVIILSQSTPHLPVHPMWVKVHDESGWWAYNDIDPTTKSPIFQTEQELDEWISRHLLSIQRGSYIATI